MLQRYLRLIVWANVKFLYFYMVPQVPEVPAVCRLSGLPFRTLVLPVGPAGAGDFSFYAHFKKADVY